MISIWAVFQVVLFIELWFSLMLVMNFFMPVRRVVVKILKFVFGNQTIKTVVFVLAIVTLFAFAYSYYTQQNLYASLKSEVFMDATKELSVRLRIFREQRNMYISGFTFFHGLFLWRLVKLYQSVESQKTKKKAEINEKMKKAQ